MLTTVCCDSACFGLSNGLWAPWGQGQCPLIHHYIPSFQHSVMTWWGAQWVIVYLVSSRNRPRRYVDAGGCMKSLRRLIVAKQIRRHKKITNTTNSIYLLHWKTFVFQCYLHIKCDLVLLFRKHKPPIWALWGAGNLKLNPIFWLKGWGESSRQRWEV